MNTDEPMIEPDWYRALLGGALLGISLLILVGKVRVAEGASGIYGGLLTRPGPGYRLTFLLGLLAVGLAANQFVPSAFGAPVTKSLGILIVAGLLVGFGTRMGSGCTSGHGIAGLSRLSLRSLVATLTFIASGALTVVVTRSLLS